MDAGGTKELSIKRSKQLRRPRLVLACAPIKHQHAGKHVLGLIGVEASAQDS